MSELGEVYGGLQNGMSMGARDRGGCGGCRLDCPSLCAGAGPSARNVCCSSPRDGDGLERAVAAKWKMNSEYIWRRVSQ